MPVDILPALRRMKIEDDVKVVFFAEVKDLIQAGKP
jgi:hypothetical protein